MMSESERSFADYYLDPILSIDSGAVLLSREESLLIINKVIEKYKPGNMRNHLSLQNKDAVRLSTDDYEYSYSEYLEEEPGYMFFSQSPGNNTEGKIIRITDCRKACKSEEAIEYFLLNEKMTYIIAVNWYVIEILGSAIDRFESIKESWRQYPSA